MKKVMVFGVFDGVHEGHRSFFRQARQRGDCLIVAVAPDDVVQRLKGHAPRLPAAERVECLRREPEVNEAVIGDSQPGSWEVIRVWRPDVVAVGYDQQSLKADLERCRSQLNNPLEIIMLRAHQPEKYHSSKL